MTDGWYFASLLGWALAWMALVRPLRLGQALLCAVCGMLLTAYLGVIVLPLRQVTAYFLMAGGLAALAAGLVLLLLDKRQLRQRVLRPSLLIWLLLCTRCLLALKDVLITDHDSYSYWMRIVRELYTDRRFPIHMDTNMSHTDYFPILAALQYCVVQVFGWQDAGLLMVIVSAILAACLAIGDLLEGTWLPALTGAVLAYLFSAFGLTVFSTRGDGPMAALLTAGLLCLFFRRDDRLASWLPSLCAAAVLTGMKIYSGLLFALVIGASMLFSIHGVKRSGQPLWALRWMSWLAVLLPVIVHFSWSILYHYHSQLAYEQAELAKAAYGLTPAVSSVSAPSLSSLLGGNPRTGELMGSLSSGLWARLQPLVAQFGDSLWHSAYPWLLAGVVLVIVLAAFQPKAQRRRTLGALLALAVAALCYTVGLIAGFVVQEEIAAVALNYMNTAFTPVLLFFVFLLIRLLAGQDEAWRFPAKLPAHWPVAAILPLMLLIQPPEAFAAQLPVQNDEGFLRPFAIEYYEDELDSFPFEEYANRHALLIDCSYASAEIKSSSGKTHAYQYFALPMRMHIVQYPVEDYDRLGELTADNIYRLLRENRCDFLFLRIDDYLYWEQIDEALGLEEQCGWPEPVGVYAVSYDGDEITFSSFDE